MEVISIIIIICIFALLAFKAGGSSEANDQAIRKFILKVEETFPTLKAKEKFPTLKILVNKNKLFGNNHYVLFKDSTHLTLVFGSIGDVTYLEKKAEYGTVCFVGYHLMFSEYEFDELIQEIKKTIENNTIAE